MREYSFRGRDASGMWHYGSLIKDIYSNYYIGEFIPKGKLLAKEIPSPRMGGKTTAQFKAIGFIMANKETLGQYVGKTDEYGNKIYNGDIVYFTDCYEHDTVVWNEDELYYYFRDSYERVSEFKSSELRVIGNIHEMENKL